MDRNWIKIDRRYSQPYRLTTHARFTVLKWIAVAFVSVIVLTLRNALADIALFLTFAYYVGIRAKRHRTDYPPVNEYEIEDETEPTGERYSRYIPNQVKAEVMRRDRGQCRKCGSTNDPHFDHIWPWSKGGTNTVNNIQILCGDCNRRKSDRV
jgi:HNH endonuclease